MKDHPGPPGAEPTGDKAARFLFLTAYYPIDPEDSWGASDLAEALVAHGHSVDVVHVAWNWPDIRETRERTEKGVKILEIPEGGIRGLGKIVYRISKFLRTSRRAAAEMRRRLDLSSYDSVVVWTPAMTVEHPLRMAVAAGIPKRLLFIFDFFPIHHREIGLVPGGPIFWWTKKREEALYRLFTTIICNFPGNVDYLKRHYRLRPGQHVVWTPIWSDISLPETGRRDEARQAYGLPLDRPIAIFGGQITEGRGIEQMLAAASAAEAAGSNLLFLFVGGGRLLHMVEAHAARSSNVRHLAAIPRNRYQPLVAACDVGMVATVPGVSSFSFPTKVMDYLRAGLPVVAAVEGGSDFLDMLARYKVGTGVDFDDSEGFYRAAERLIADPEVAASIRRNSIACLEEIFDPVHTVRVVLDAVRRDEPEEVAA